MSVSISKGSDRNTQAYIVCVNEYRLYFSYETCMAVDTPYGRFRRENIWGPTTGRHLKEMRVYNYPVIKNAELFERAIQTIGSDNCAKAFIQLSETLRNAA